MTQKPTSVSDLLGKAGGVLERLRDGASQADRVLGAVRRHLPADLRERVWGASLRAGHLTVMVASAAWATRIRYQAPQLRQALAPELGQIERMSVKVRPAGAEPRG